MSKIHLDGNARILAAKVAAHSMVRRIRWLAQPEQFTKPRRDAGILLPHRVHHSSTPLFRSDEASDPILERGKAVNVALAAAKIHELNLSCNHPFSFWRSVGRIRAEDGYKSGLEIHGGCLVPSLGGGVCLLSNALFEMAARLGWIIHERHGHTKEAVPPSGPLWGLDATVLYPYVDLRFAPRRGNARLHAWTDDTHLHLEVYSDQPLEETVTLVQRGDRVVDGWRENTVVQRRSRNGVFLGEEVVAQSRREILHTEQQARTCLTCEEFGCSSRARFLGQLAVAP